MRWLMAAQAAESPFGTTSPTICCFSLLPQVLNLLVSRRAKKGAITLAEPSSGHYVPLYRQKVCMDGDHPEVKSPSPRIASERRVAQGTKMDKAKCAIAHQFRLSTRMVSGLRRSKKATTIHGRRPCMVNLHPSVDWIPRE